MKNSVQHILGNETSSKYSGKEAESKVECNQRPWRDRHAERDSVD